MLREPPKFLPGFGYGERLPALMLAVSGPAMTAAQRQDLSDRFLAMLEGGKASAPIAFDAAPFAEGGEGSTQWFLALIDRIQAAAGLPELARGRVIRRSGDADHCIVPAMHHALVPLSELIRLLSRFIGQTADDPGRAAMAEEAARHFADLRIGRYRARLQAAANRDGIVMQQLSDLAFQFGIGRHSVLMDSTITEHTSSIGVRLARRKAHAAAALRRMGLPVPDHRLAAGEDEAVRIAAQLSYPVVVKPADLDGGAGCFPI